MPGVRRVAIVVFEGLEVLDAVGPAEVFSQASRLESGRTPLTAVARDCGFGTAETMRRAFHRRPGVAPADYRARFHTPEGAHDADRHPRLRALSPRLTPSAPTTSSRACPARK